MRKIIIPSKNIYSKSNDIIKKNSIEKVLFNYNEARVETQEHIEVGNLTVTDFDTQTSSHSEDIDFSGKIDTSNYHFYGVITGVRISRFYRTKTDKVYTIPFNNFDNNSYVDGVDGLQIEDISVFGTLEKYSGTATITVYPNGDIGCGSITTDTETPTSTQELTYTIPDSFQSSKTDTITVSGVSQQFSSTSQVDIEKTIKSSSPETDLDSNNLEVWALSGIEATPVGIEYWTISHSTEDSPGVCSSAYYAPATKYVYTPKEVYIKVNGSTTVVKLTNTEIQKTAEKSSNPFSIESNELMQDKNTYEKFAQKVLDLYKNGKETAIIRCGVNDYYKTNYREDRYEAFFQFTYDEITKRYIYTFPDNMYVFRSKPMVKALWGNEEITYYEAYAQNNKIYVKPLPEHIGNIRGIYLTYDYIELEKELEKAIDITNGDSMCFKMHDVVLPMIRNPIGEDEFISKDKNGNPKAFEVIGINMIYDGAVYQELTLQEYKE